MPKSGGKNCLSPNVGPNVASSENVASKHCGAKMWLQAQMWWRLRNDGNVASNNVASKCGVKHKFGGASENDRNVASNNVASGTNVVAVRNVASNNAASKCGVRHKCGGSPKCGVKQCGVKMWRQTLPLPNCLPGNVSSKKVFSGRHKSATLNACALLNYMSPMIPSQESDLPPLPPQNRETSIFCSRQQI